jgi:hypothetical protein
VSVVVMGFVWSSTLKGSNRRHVLLAMADRADEDGVCWPGYGHLAKKTDLSRRSVIRIVDELEEEGWVWKDNTRSTSYGDQDTNLYQINIPMLKANQQAAPNYDEERAERLARIAAAKKRRSEGGDTVTPPPGEPDPDDPGGSDTTTPPPAGMSPPPCQEDTTPGATVTPNPSEDPSCDPSGGGVALVDAPTVPAPSGPPPPRSLPAWVDLADPSSWVCRRHHDDPIPIGEYRPPCGPCGQVREAAQLVAPRLVEAELDAAVAAERAAAAVARDCPWCIESPVKAGQWWRVDERRVPLAPVVVCDHSEPSDLPEMHSESASGQGSAEVRRILAEKARARSVGKV